MLLMVVALVAVSANCSSDEEATWKVGALFDLTGTTSNLGIPEQNTVNMMVDQINADGGINGADLEVIIYDTEGDNDTVATMASRLIDQDEVLAIIGPTRSPTSLHIIDTVTAAKIPMVSCAANAGIVTPVNERFWVFKTPQTDQEAVTELYLYMESQGVSDIALLTDTSGFGEGGKAILMADAADYGLTIVAALQFDNGDSSMIPQLTNIGGTSAEAVVCWTTDSDAATVALDMDTLQMEMTLYCSHGIANMNFITSAGDAANGVIFPAGKLLVVEDLPADDPQKEVLTQYRDDYEAIYGSGTISTFGGHAYDALEMVVMALEDLDTIYFPENAVLADVRAALRTGIEGTTDFIGISGIFTMSPTNHLGMQPGSLVLIEIVDQQWTALAQ